MRILIFPLLVFSALGLALHFYFVRQLRERHPRVWESMGQPSVFWSNTLGTRFEVWRFLWKKEYEELGDSQFTRLAGLLRIYKIAYAILLGVVIVGSFIWAYAAVATHHI
jgi:hypothetical protein